MGIDVGPLVMGHIGHAETASITVIGNTVNAASRLEALTKEKKCQLIVSADVLEQAGVDLDRFAVEQVAMRGFSAPRSVALVKRARKLPPIEEPQMSPAETATQGATVPSNETRQA
jgi:adenylate cyclase